MSVHKNGPVCTGCESKLTSAHPYMRGWFHRIKAIHPDAHISWAGRGEADQNAMYEIGREKTSDGKWIVVGQVKTNAPWPNSPHNHMENGVLQSLALDLFQLIEGRAIYDPLFYAKVDAYNETRSEPVIWGHKFKGLADTDHFELVESYT